MDKPSSKNIGIKVDVHRTSSSVWSTSAADLTGDGAAEFILGRMDGHIEVQSVDDKILWTADVGGLPYSIRCGDLNSDGSPEVIVTSFDEKGTLYAFDSQGEQLWSYSMGSALLGLEISDLNNDGKKEVLTGGINTPLICLNHHGDEIWKENWTNGISVIRVGDINGNGKKEIVIGQPKNSILAFEQDGTLLLEWIANPDAKFFGDPNEIIIEDLTGDGINEIIAGTRPSNRTTVLNGKGEILWQHNDLISSTIIPNCANPMLTVGDFSPTPGKEVLVMTFDQMLFLFSASGEKLMTKRLPFPLMSITSLDHNGNSLLTGSGIRETQFFTLTFVTDAIDQLNLIHLEHQAMPNLEVIRAQVDKFPALPLAKTRNSQPYSLIYKSQEPSKAFRHNIPLIYELLKKRHDSENLNVEMEFLSWEVGFKNLTLGFLNPTYFTSEELIEVAAFCEENEIPFWFQIWHSKSQFVSLRTIEGVLKAAPKMNRGFMFSETFPDEVEVKMKLLGFLEGVMQLCKKHGEKKVIFHINQSRFFHRVMVDPEYFKILSNEDYHNIFIPMLKPNNSPETDLAVAGAAGLWRSNMVSNWGYSTQIGNWRWPGIEREHLLPWDVLMRQELVAASLGAKYFRIERPEMYLNIKRDESNNNRVTDISVYEDQVIARDLFYTLLKKGVLQQGEAKEHKSFSPVVFQEFYDKFKTSGSSFDGGLFSAGYGPQIVSPSYAPGYVYGSSGEPNRFARGILRDNPYGVLTIIPEGASIDETPGARLAWKTDGATVEHDNKIESAINVRNPILKSFELASTSLPFRVEKMWLSAVRWEEDLYVLYAIDPGCFEAQGADENVQVNLPWDDFTVTDRITGENLSVHNKSFKLIIPAGVFRIIEVCRAR